MRNGKGDSTNGETKHNKWQANVKGGLSAAACASLWNPTCPAAFGDPGDYNKYQDRLVTCSGSVTCSEDFKPID